MTRDEGGAQALAGDGVGEDPRLPAARRLRAQGRSGEARATAEAVLRERPDDPAAGALLARMDLGTRRGADAAGRIADLVRRHPLVPECHVALAELEQARHGAAAAIAPLERAAGLAPGRDDILVLLARANTATGRHGGAEVALRRLLERSPRDPDAWAALGSAMAARGRWEKAVVAYRNAAGLAPDRAAAHASLGLALLETASFDEALDALGEALRIDPRLGGVHTNLGHLHSRLNRRQEALRHFRLAVDTSPWAPEIYSNYLFNLIHEPDLSPAEVRDAHAEYGRRFGVGARAAPHRNGPDPDRVLKVGYVSADFRRHAVMQFLEPVLRQHDRARVEIHCYAARLIEDETTARARALVPHWRSIAGLSDRAAADLVRRDGIDVLVDLSGHTAGNRLPVFGLRPAPVQVTWLGYPNTTGLAEIDYRIVAGRTPEAADALSIERLHRMPSTSACFEPDAAAPDPAPPPSLKTGCLTFGSFNAPAKLNDEVIGAWAAILQRVPGSRLMLKYGGLDHEAAQDGFRRAFAAHGTASERILFEGASPYLEYLQAYGRIDVALDPFPYAGGTTTRNALWMGCPVVTLEREAATHNVAATILREAGLADTVAATLGDYVDVAVRLAADPSALAARRLAARPALAGQAGFDPALFTRQLEDAWRTMWRRWCAGQAGREGRAEPPALRHDFGQP